MHGSANLARGSLCLAMGQQGVLRQAGGIKEQTMTPRIPEGILSVAPSQPSGKASTRSFPPASAVSVVGVIITSVNKPAPCIGILNMERREPVQVDPIGDDVELDPAIVDSAVTPFPIATDENKGCS